MKEVKCVITQKRTPQSKSQNEHCFITAFIPFSIQFFGIQSGSDEGGGGGGGGGRSTGGLLPFLLPSFTLRISSGLKEGPGGGFF